MKSREMGLRLKRFAANEAARKVADLESMIREFETMSADLERQIGAEEDRTGIRDRAHFAYSTFAKSAAARRDKLRASVDELRGRLEAAQREKDAAEEQLSLAGSAEPREDLRSRRRPERAAGAALR